MATGSSATGIGSSSTATSSKIKDIGWNYGTPVDGQRDHVKCNFCGVIKKGGITRLKQHLVGGYRNTTKCAKCPVEVSTTLKEHMQKKSSDKELQKQLPSFDTIFDVEDDEYDEMERIPKTTSGIKGPLDVYYQREPAKKRKGDGGDVEKARKQLRDVAVQKFARWMYDAGLAFNAVNYESLQQAIEAIGQYGAGMKAPTMHEVRVTCLKKEKEHTEKLIQENKEEAEEHGCTLMADGWTDRNGRVLVNFLMNTPKGSVFLDTVDASDYSKTGAKMCDLLSKYIEQIGAENVVQVVTDNASENVLAGM